MLIIRNCDADDTDPFEVNVIIFIFILCLIDVIPIGTVLDVNDLLRAKVKVTVLSAMIWRNV